MHRVIHTAPLMPLSYRFSTRSHTRAHAFLCNPASRVDFINTTIGEAIEKITTNQCEALTSIVDATMEAEKQVYDQYAVKFALLAVAFTIYMLWQKGR